MDISSLPHLESLLQTRSIRSVLRSTDLAQVGDFLTNYIYTIMRIGIKGRAGSIHVWDQSLASAARESGLRRYFGSRAQKDTLADGVEALIAFTYLREVYTLEEMVGILSDWISPEDFISRSAEITACGSAFENLIRKILARSTELFTDL